MTSRSPFFLGAAWLLAVSLVGCANGRTAHRDPEGDPAMSSIYGAPEPALPGKATFAYDLGISIPNGGDMLLDHDAGVAGGLQGSYMLTEHIGLQAMFGGTSAAEEETDAVFGGQFGNYRQEVSIFSLTVGPRFAYRFNLDPGNERSHRFVEIFADGGFGGYFTRVEVDFPRGVNSTAGQSTHEVDATTDFGLNGGGGLIISLTEAVYIGAVIRQHWAAFRPEKDESFMGSNDRNLETPMHAGVFADSGGGRSDNLLMLQISAMFAFRF